MVILLIFSVFCFLLEHTAVYSKMFYMVGKDGKILEKARWVKQLLTLHEYEWKYRRHLQPLFKKSLLKYRESLLKGLVWSSVRTVKYMMVAFLLKVKGELTFGHDH